MGSPITPTPGTNTSSTQGREEALQKKIEENLLASPPLTGTPTAPTAAPGTSTTQVATTAFVGAAVAAAVGSSGKGTEVTINKEEEPSTSATALVALYGEVEKASAPLVKVEVDGQVTIEGTLIAPAGANAMLFIGLVSVKAKGKYKVPAVAGLLKLFASKAVF